MQINQRLLNSYEEVTYDALARVCASNDARVFPKVRIADVFPLERSGVSPSHFTYGLRAHFDFLVTTADYRPLFSVEFDGPLHRTDNAQHHRDRLKNELCEHFHHGLLRINSNYVSKTYRGLDLLTYFVDAWFLEQAFNEAQRNGTIPWDEPFDITFVYSDGTKDGRKWPYWLSIDVQLAIQRLHHAGSIGQMAASHCVGCDAAGNYRCLAWVVLDTLHVVEATTGMRAQRFSAVDQSDLISMLATFDLVARVDAAIRGSRTGMVDRDWFFSVRLPRFRANYEMRTMATVGAVL